jgi:hypothetical protein
MFARPTFALTAVVTIAALAGCEPSLMGDFGGRGASNANANASGSSGNNTWNSPRWAANNPQQPQSNAAASPNGAQPAANGAQAAQANGAVAQNGATPSVNGTVQQQTGPAPWGAQANGGAVQPGTGTVTSGPVINPATAPVCEDNRPRALDLPGDSCARPCRATWQRCFDGCNGGQDRQCVAACDDAFRDCMRGCY